MELYEKNGNILYILNILKKYSEQEHMLTAVEIREKVIEEYGMEIDVRTIKRNIQLLKHKFEYDISTREENGKGYYYTNNPDIDFEPGELRVIIDVFNYSDYIVPSIAEQIIDKCKNIQNVYENKKLENYRVFAKNKKTQNMEVIKNIEDISNAIVEGRKIKFNYSKFTIEKVLKEVVLSTPTVSPYAIIYEMQEFYLVCLKEGADKLYHYRLDRIRDVEVLEEKIIKKTEEEIASFTKTSVNMHGGQSEEITAICKNETLNYVLNKFGKNITIKKLNKDEFELKVDADINGFYIWALNNIDGIEVEKPIELRNKIKDVLKIAQERYSK